VSTARLEFYLIFMHERWKYDGMGGMKREKKIDWVFVGATSGYAIFLALLVIKTNISWEIFLMMAIWCLYCDDRRMRQRIEMLEDRMAEIT